RRLGCRTANEPGAPVVSSTPEQLPGHEPVSARKGYEDGTAFLLRHRRCQGPLGRDGVAGGVVLVGGQRRGRLGRAGREAAWLAHRRKRHRGERRPTSAASCAPCLLPACRCGRSIHLSFAGSPRRAAFWPRTIGSTRA